MRHLALAASITALPLGALAQEAVIVPGAEHVTYVNVLTPADGVTLDALAA